MSDFDQQVDKIVQNLNLVGRLEDFLEDFQDEAGGTLIRYEGNEGYRRALSIGSFEFRLAVEKSTFHDGTEEGINFLFEIEADGDVIDGVVPYNHTEEAWVELEKEAVQHRFEDFIAAAYPLLFSYTNPEKRALVQEQKP